MPDRAPRTWPRLPTTVDLTTSRAAAAVPILAGPLGGPLGGPGADGPRADGPDQVSDARPRHWERLRRGAYVDGDGWRDLVPAAQTLVLAHAMSEAADTGRLFSHCTAARAWDLPTIGWQQTCVEVLVADGRTGRSPGLIRRRTQNLPVGVEVAGLTVTSPSRTVVDIARVQSLASGVSVMDSALRRGLAARDEIQEEVRRVPRGGRGRQRAALALALADPGGESAGESLSRVRLYEAGLPPPRLQVEFRDHQGLIGRVDMYWEEWNVVGEFDGRMKYTVGAVQSAEQAGEVVWREKLREDRLRASGLTVVRWTWAEAWGGTAMLRKLRLAGLRGNHSNRWPTPALPSGVPNA